jgi:hypothetical protein
MAIEVPAKDVTHILRATFPDYRRRSVCIVTTGQATLHDLNWSGGTRNEYRACTLDGKPIHARRDINAPHPLDNTYEGQTVIVPVGCAIVQAGFFCGKASRAYIYINDVDFNRMLETRTQPA